MKIKIELDGLTLDQATDLTNFLSSLKPLNEPKQIVQNSEEIKPEPVLEKPKTTRKKAEKVGAQEVPEQEVPEQEVPEQKAEDVEVPEQKAEDVKVIAPEVVSPSALTVGVLRTKLASKIAEDRAFLNTIKAKLTELGAANVSTLKEAHYKAFNDFLTAL